MDLSSLMEPPEGEDEPAVPVIRFINGEQLFREIDSMGEIDTLLVKNVSPAAFGMLERKREARGRKFRFNWYDENSRLLLVSLNTGAHEQLHGWLYIDGIFFGLLGMGLRDSWTTMGATVHYHGGLSSGEIGERIAFANRSISDSNGGGSSGEPDSSGGPWLERGGRRFPSLVIEAGCCRPLSIMQAKAKWWFNISNHDVKIVLLIKLYESRQIIVVEKWEERPRESREGATTTRWGSERVPYCQQVVTITKTSGNTPVYQISGDLVLNFRLLCLREPREGEGDVVISADELQVYAKRVFME